MASVSEQGKLLDVGTGPGKLLKTIQRYNINLVLYGLDISKSMIKLAHKNLKSIDVDLRVGKIQDTDYKGNFFDLITCTGNFYLWNEPEKDLNEIYRMLKIKKVIMPRLLNKQLKMTYTIEKIEKNSEKF